jgi:hypothetical protein
VLAGHGHFFGNGEVVVFWLLPINEPDGLGLLPGAGLDLDAVAQQAVDRFVGVVEMFAFAQGGGLVEAVQRPADQDLIVAAPLQPVAQQPFFNVGVVGPILPVAQVGVAELLPEQLTTRFWVARSNWPTVDS